MSNNSTDQVSIVLRLTDDGLSAGFEKAAASSGIFSDSLKRNANDAASSVTAIQARINAMVGIEQSSRKVASSTDAETDSLKRKIIALTTSTEAERLAAETQEGLTRTRSAAARSAAVFLASEVDQKRSASAASVAYQNAIANEAAANKRSADLMRQQNAERFADEQRTQEKLNALHTQAIIMDRSIRARGDEEINAAHEAALLENYLIEKRAQEKLNALHTQAIIEDRARARRAANQPEARSGVGEALSGAGSVLGLGYGATAAGVGIAGASAVIFSSKQAIDFERANQALTAATGNARLAGDALSYARVQAERLGLDVVKTALSYAQFTAAAKGTALEGAQAVKIFEAITETSAKLHLSADDTQGALIAVTQMMSKGSVQAEELRGQLGDRLPGAFNIMARAIGVTTAQLDSMLKQGGVASADVLPKFAAELERTFGTDANTRIETTTANFNRLWNQIKLTSAELGVYINKVASPVAGRLADDLAGVVVKNGVRGRMLDNPGVFDGGTFVSEAEYQKAAAATPLYQGYQYGQKTPAPLAIPNRYRDPNDGLSGTALLTANQVPVDADNVAKIQARIVATKELTAVEKFQADQKLGLYKDESNYEQQLRLQEAQADDEKKAREDAERAAAKADRQAETDAERERKVAVSYYGQEVIQAEKEIENARIKGRIAQEELDTGRALTEARKQLIALEERSSPALEESTKYEFSKLSASEAQVRAKKMLLDLDEQERAQLERNAIAEIENKAAKNAEVYSRQQGAAAKQQSDQLFGRRQGIQNINGARSYGALSDATDAARQDTKDRYEQEKKDALDFYLDGTIQFEDYQKRKAAIERRYATESVAVEEAARQAKDKILTEQLDSAAGIFGQLGDIAKTFGKEGFEVYKSLKIAEALVAIPSSAIKAYDSTVGIPIVGPYLAPVAAGVAVATGLVQLSAIESAQYQGRQYGGPVSGGGLYEVAEGGDPELLRVGNRTMLMMGDDSGTVIPAKRAQQAAGGGLTVNVVNAPAGSNPDVKMDGNVVTIDMIPGIVGQAARASVPAVAASIKTGNGPVNQAIVVRHGVPVRPRQ